MTENIFNLTHNDQHNDQHKMCVGCPVGRIATILRDSNDAITVQDTNGNILAWNFGAVQIYGYTEEEALKLNIRDLIPERHRSESDSFLTKIKNGEIVKSFETKRITKNGCELDIWLTVTALRDQNGLIESFSTTERDVSEVNRLKRDLKEKAENLEKALEEARNSNKAKSVFLANMSHEIRTPLGAIMGFSELLIEPKIGSSEKLNFVAAIKRNGEMLSNIINDILDLSKVEAGKMEVCVRETALIEVLTDIKTLLSLQARDKGIELKLLIKNDVPEIIKTDPLRLRQILINIIGNAIKFTSKGYVSVTVQCSIGRNGQQILSFDIEDTGKGISPDQIGKLFAPFSQIIDESKRRYGGTGLGLVLSKRLANLLGGDVVLARSKESIGSTFTITVDPGPIHGVLYAKSRNGEKGKDIVKDGPRLDDVRVLLADDAPDNQILVSRILMLAGAIVDVASNGKEAIEKIHSDHYDVLLMDLQMPVMDGYEATAELRKEGYRGKIIALTAHAMTDEKLKCLQSGFDDHLSKPVNRNTLLERIDLFSREGKSQSTHYEN